MNMEQETLYNVLSGAYGEVLETHAMWECIVSLGIKPYKDGNQWCYLYGDNIQDGIVGFGETIFKAAWNFYSQIKIEEIAKCEHRGSSEIPNDLEEAANDYLDGIYGKMPHSDSHIDIFIAGAKWHKEQTEKDPDKQWDNLQSHFKEINEAFEEGKKAMREQLMKEAVEGEVVVPIYEGDNTWSSEIEIPGRYEIGDKVRIIIVKED